MTAPSRHDVREGMRRLPRWTQPALTLLTGKPHWGQKTLWRPNGVGHVVTTLAGLFGGAIGAAWLFSVGPIAWIGIIPCWLLVVGSARKIQVTLAHQSVTRACPPPVRIGTNSASVLPLMSFAS